MTVQPARYYTTADPPACSCPDFCHRGRERPCKHIRALRDALELVAAVGEKWREIECPKK